MKTRTCIKKEELLELGCAMKEILCRLEELRIKTNDGIILNCINNSADNITDSLLDVAVITTRIEK